jgi:tRNA(adenine34) deaminase
MIDHHERNVDDDWHYMGEALRLAEVAAAVGEVPVGALLVRDGNIIAAAHNEPIGQHDPTAHAEILTLRRAAAQLQNYRLTGYTLYVTLEPCAMCVGAILHARVDRVVWGAADPKTGACGGQTNLAGHPQLNHQTRFVGGVMADACGEILRQFFRTRRKKPA